MVIMYASDRVMRKMAFDVFKMVRNLFISIDPLVVANIPVLLSSMSLCKA